MAVKKKISREEYENLLSRNKNNVQSNSSNVKTISQEQYNSLLSRKNIIPQTNTNTKNNNAIKSFSFDINNSKYKDTGKTIGNYIKNSSLKNSRIYSNNGKFYYFNDKNNKYEEITNKTGYSVTKTNNKEKKPIAPVSEHFINNKKIQANNGKYENPNQKVTARDDSLGLADRLKVEFSGKNPQQKAKLEKKLVQEEKNNSRISGLVKGIAKNGIVQAGAFDDGYQAGDVTKTILGTGGDVFNSIGKGVLKTIEGTGDFINYRLADVSDMLGNKSLATTQREFAKKNLVDDYTKPGDEVYRKNSILGNKTSNVVEGVGQVLGNVALGGLGKTTKLATAIVSGNTFMSSAGQGTSQAYQEGANDKDANTYGLISGVAETLTEMMFGGLGKGTKAIGISKSAIPIDDAIAKKISSKFSSALAKNLTNYTIKATGEGLEEVASGLIQGIGKKLTYQSDKKLGDILKDEDLLDQFINGAVVSGIVQTPGLVSATKNNIDLNSMIDESDGVDNKISDNLEIEQPNNNLSLKEQVNPNNIYQYEQTDNNKINNLRQSAVNENLDNSEKTHNLLNTIENVISDKNYNVTFDSSIVTKTGKPINAQITTNQNNEVEIKINPNSDRAGEFLLVHEITHATETDSMKQLVIDYASKNSEFNQALEDLKQIYETQDVSDEVLADISGQLFGNQEFINELSTKQPNIFKKIYNKIIELANKITGNSKESLFIKDLKNKWQEAYSTQSNNLSNATKYMMTSKQGMENGLEVNSRYEDIKNRYNNALDLTNKNYSNEEVRQKTGWFKDNNGNWEFEISDHNTKVKIQPKTNTKYKLLDIFEASTLYDMYPGLKNVDVEFRNVKRNGNYNSEIQKITINNKILDNLENLRGTLLHEIQHYIQNQEGLPTGTTILFGNEQYANSKGEIEAADTKNRRDMTVEERKKISPESSKENPIHPNRENILKHKRNTVEKIAEQIYNNFGGNSNEIFEEIGFQNNKQTNESFNRTYKENKNGVEELDNSSFSLKERQLDIILKNNPAFNETSTWIRKVEDIKTLKETLQDNDWADYSEFNPDLSKQDIQDAIKNGKIMVYSSYPIEQGIFVSPSKMEAESYSGSGKIYSKEVSIGDVAWIDPTQGQYAKVDTKYSQESDKWQEHLEKNYKATGTRTNFNDIKTQSERAIAPLRKQVKEMSKTIAPLKQEIKQLTKELENTKKVLNPIEISKLTQEDANTTPNLPIIKRNKVNDGDSRFYSNIKNKTNMLNESQKQLITSDADVKYYDKVTNRESLEKAYNQLNENGKNETIKWFSKDTNNANATDVAEGWILLKQYADNGDTDGMVEVAKKMREIGTKAGQTVQAFNIMERMTPEGMVKYAQSELLDAYDKMVKNKSKAWIDKHRADFDLKPDEVKFIMDNMNEISKMQDGYDKRVKLAEIQKLMTDKLPPVKGSQIKAWMRISMLFNPKTQVRNVVGNAMIAPVNYFGDLFSSYTDKIIAKKTGVRTTGNMNVKAILKGFKEGAYQATNDYRKGINTKDMEGNRFEIGEAKSFNDKHLIGKSLNRVEGLLNYVMDAGDRVFSQSSFENSLQNQMILNNTTEVTQDMIDIARTESLQRTWNDNNNYTKFVLDIRRAANKVGTENYGLGDVLIPFAKTPANITKAIVDYSPVGLVNAMVQGDKLMKSLNNGQYTPQMQHKFVQTLGKATAGSLLYIVGVALAKSGTTSGKSDDDKDVSNFLKNTLGVSSYSIKIGGKTFTYDWAQPLAAPLSITANVVNSKNKETALAEAIIGNLDTAGSVLLEQSFLTGLNEVLNDKKGVVTGLVNQILNLPSRAIPTFSKQIADMVDGTQRNTYEYGKPVESAINSAKIKIPGLSKTLAPSVDTLGREIKKYGGKNNLFNVFLNPANVNTENISESAKEIYRLYKETGDKTIMPRVAPYYINKDGEKITLTSKQREKFQKQAGQTIEDGVSGLMKTSEYIYASDEEKADMVNGIVGYAYNIAQHEELGTEISQSYRKANNFVNKGGNLENFYIYKNSTQNMDSNEKEDYLYNSEFSSSQKTLLYENVMLSNFEDPSKHLKYKTSKQLGIDIDNWLNYSSQKFDNLYNSKGQTIKNSKRNAIINFVNSLDLSIPQKASLIKMSYSSYKKYDNQIMNYIDGLELDYLTKAKIVKSLGFTKYNKSIINYVRQNYSSVNKQSSILDELGFKVYQVNGKTYVR